MKLFALGVAVGLLINGLAVMAFDVDQRWGQALEMDDYLRMRQLERQQQAPGFEHHERRNPCNGY